MITDNEKWQEGSGENPDAGRDGNRSFNRSGYDRRDDNRPSFNRENRFNREGSDRPQRPSFNRYNNDRPQRPSYNREDGEQRPRFNNRDDRFQRPYNRDNSDRPQRPSYNREGGDRPQRPSYNREGGDRPRFNQYNNDRPQRVYTDREDRPWRNNSNEFERPIRRPIPNSQAGNRDAGNREGGEMRSRRPRFVPGERQQQYPMRSQQGGARPMMHRRTPDYDPNAKYSKKKQIEYKEQVFDPNEPIRLNKFMANAGVCSRREADEFITSGVVSVNGVVVTELGTKVKRSDSIKFHDEPVSIERKIYVLLNKPKDCVTTSDDPQARKTVMDFVKDACTERIYSVGRLDRNTTGVLLLTNDGDLASKLTHPKYLKKKIYYVQTDKNVTKQDMDQIAAGIQLDDGEIRADEICYTDDVKKDQVGIEIHSGKNRIVRRIFESLGYRVVKLDRVFFAGLTKKGLKRGDWRYLTETEVNMLRMGAFE